jgi:HD-like signal output (HDOD) protein
MPSPPNCSNWYNTSEAAASKSVLGISFEELGIAVAEKWNFPDKIVSSMKRLSGKELQGRNVKNNNALQGLSNFSNELCYIINDTEEIKEAGGTFRIWSEHRTYHQRVQLRNCRTPKYF